MNDKKIYKHQAIVKKSVFEFKMVKSLHAMFVNRLTTMDRIMWA